MCRRRQVRDGERLFNRRLTATARSSAQQAILEVRSSEDAACKDCLP